eukprot:5468925-Prymnesium_polylepis.1
MNILTARTSVPTDSSECAAKRTRCFWCARCRPTGRMHTSHAIRAMFIEVMPTTLSAPAQNGRSASLMLDRPVASTLVE